MKETKLLFLSKHCKENRVSCSKKYIKTDYTTVILIDEYRMI